MKNRLKRLLSIAISASMVVVLPAPTQAASDADITVYDNVLDRYEEDFIKSVRLDESGKTVATGEEWFDDIETIGINRERSHSQFVPYQNAEAALASEKSVMDDVGPEQSEYYQLLSDKDWDFALVKTPAEAKEKDAEYLAMPKAGPAAQAAKNMTEPKVTESLLKENAPEPTEKEEEAKDNQEEPAETEKDVPSVEQEGAEDAANPPSLSDKEEAGEAIDAKEESTAYQPTANPEDTKLLLELEQEKELADVSVAPLIPEEKENQASESQQENSNIQNVESEKPEVQPIVQEDETQTFASGDFEQKHVPQSWQTYKNADGTFQYDEPMYSNHFFPWGSMANTDETANIEKIDYANPHAPESYNPVGYYRTTFDTPSTWDGREIFLSFQGVESAYYLYVNGNLVGYSTDSATAHDFNVTPYLNPAGQSNTMALKVFRWSIGSWLENQDFVRLSGIHRDVYLYSKGEAEIRDIFAKTKLENRSSVDSDATVTVDTVVRGLHNEQEGSYTLSTRLVDNKDAVVARGEDKSVTIAASADKTLKEKLLDAGQEVSQTLQVTNPAKWFPDTPNLYRLVVELKKADGTVLETAVQRLGFREVYKVDINDKGQEQMQITGKQIVLRGTNRHDIDLELGHALTKEDIETDLLLMKEYNLNAVRTSHYPNDQHLFDAADELGLYVCAEANIESHRAAFGPPTATAIPGGTEESRKPEWVATVLDRTANMIERYKNRTSIIMWSLGNEATYTTAPLDEQYCFWVTSMYMLKRDPDRFRKYERESGRAYTKAEGADPWSTEVRKNNIVDMYSTQYPSPAWTESYAKGSSKMPYIHSEYNHAMGQSYGNAKEHWDVIREYDNVQGGFIWDWIDQSVETTKGGKTFWGYGGDWIDAKANDDAFCGNGLAFADRTASPKLVEAKKVHQQVSFYKTGTEAVGKELEVKVVNEFENTNLSAFDVAWKFTEDGQKTLASGTLPLSVNPINGVPLEGTENAAVVNIPIPNFTPKEGSDYLLDFTVTYKKDTPWAKAGAELAFEQMELQFDHAEAAEQLDVSTMKPFSSVTQSGNVMTLKGETADKKTFEITVDTSTGTISTYKVDGKTIIKSGPEQSYWRGQTYNDTTVAVIPALKNAGAVENMKDIDANVQKSSDNKKVSLSMTAGLAVEANAAVSFDIYSNGEIVVLNQMSPEKNFAANGLPKVGSRMIISEEYQNLSYYGRGPGETYVDRKSGSRVGVYKSTVDKQFESKMLKPQENGNRTDVRWTALTNEAGEGLLVSGQDVLESSALHYTAEELNSGGYDTATYRHPVDVPQRKDVVWNIDLHQHGVSDTAFSGHKPLDGYRFDTSTSYSYSYKITPITKSSDLTQLSNVDFAISKALYPITAIYLNGKPLSGFNVKQTEYTIMLDPETSGAEFTADSIGGTTITMNDGVAVITGKNMKDEAVSYTIKLKRKSKTEIQPVKAYVDNFYSGEGPEKAVDGDAATIWHSNWADASSKELSKLWITVELPTASVINGVSYLPRNNGKNGTYQSVEVYGGEDNATWGTPVGSATWDSSYAWKTAEVSVSKPVKYIKLQPTATYGDTVNVFGSAAEIRLTAPDSMNGAEITFEKSYPLVGGAATPDPKVVLNGVQLIKGVDYTVAYENNTVVGTATATVVPKGAFVGDAVEKDFTVTPAITHTVTVVGGTADKEKAEENEVVTLSAVTPTGKEFVNWTSDDVLVKDANKSTTTFVMPNKDVTITANFKNKESGGSSSGGGGGGGSLSGGSSNTSTTTKPSAAEKDAAVSVPKSSETTTKDGVTATTTTMTNGQVKQDVKISTEAIKGDATAGKTVKLPSAPVSVSKDKNLASTVTISLPEDVKDPVKVEIPLDQPTPGTVVILVDETGKETIVKTAVAGTDSIALSVQGTATVKVVDNSKSFEDVSSSDWSKDAVDFVTSRELFNGTSDGAFSPAEPMTRGMLVTVMHRLADSPNAGDPSFADVAQDAYYAQAVAWASANGIVSGTGNGFQPEGQITREQLSAILYRYAGSPVVSGNGLSNYEDGKAVSDFASQSMAWAVEQGILTGKTATSLAPGENASRAEVATMLQRFVTKTN